MVTTQIAGSHKGAVPINLRDAYQMVKDRIAEAAIRSGRQSSDVLCVAVTKSATPDEIRAMVEMGHTDMGEGRVQQLVQRVALMDEFLARKHTLAGAANKPVMGEGRADQIRWHMIGHLQRNKVKQVIPLVQLIHSVDSLRLAEEIHNYAARTDKVADILIEVNASGETNKFGVAPAAVAHLAEQIDTMLNLRLRGLMTMAPRGDRAEEARPYFARTAEIFHDMRCSNSKMSSCNILSMGMSDDFEVAIEEGANVVRIGRAIFGEPEKV